MTKTAALEFGRAKIRVNAICPGSILTPMIAPTEFPGVDQQAFWSSLPIPRAGEAEEVAKVALFLACDDSAYVTGAELTVDGGETAGRMVEGIE
jgi:3alpha(or 20beta)-hydroxysteroid dehydrogenase